MKIVADEAMPLDIDWAFACIDGDTVLIMSRSASGNERALSEAWAAYRCMSEAKGRADADAARVEAVSGASRVEVDPLVS